ncbi:MAG: hypothetical protein LBP26_02465 [Clostridiales bacterium]|jgi:hypothetical protein|nr:hypothetical protein [Clostridiales bacterium]
MYDTILLTALCVAALALAGLFILAARTLYLCNQKSAAVEGKFLFDSKKLVWRVTNTSRREITIVEIGLRAGPYAVYYRPLQSAEDGLNVIPNTLRRGQIASYRKEIDRFLFRQSEIEMLQVENPYVAFYVKDAEGRAYGVKTDVKFTRYLAEANK